MSKGTADSAIGAALSTPRMRVAADELYDVAPLLNSGRVADAVRLVLVRLEHVERQIAGNHKVVSYINQALQEMHPDVFETTGE